MTLNKKLGELVLRTSDVDTLAEFYIDVIGLEPYACFKKNRFLKIADDIEGHPEILAIFDNDKDFAGPKIMKKGTPDSRLGTLHHFAFALEKEDFIVEKNRLKKIGIQLQEESYELFGWNFIHFHDPDGNAVEFVCYDEKDLNVEKNLAVKKNIK